MTPIEKAIALQQEYAELQRFDEVIDELQEFSTDQLHQPDKTNKWVKKLKTNTQVSIMRRMQAIQKEMAELIRQDKGKRPILTWEDPFKEERKAAEAQKGVTWDIFNVGNSENERLQVQRIDEPERHFPLASDEKAIELARLIYANVDDDGFIYDIGGRPLTFKAMNDTIPLAKIPNKLPS